MSLLDYAKLYDIEDDAFCHSVIRNYYSGNWQNHLWNGPSGFQYESNHLEVLFHNDVSENMTHDIVGTVVADYSRTFDIGLTHFTPPRYNRYKESTCIRKHNDHIHDIFDGDRRGIPIVSVVGLLNDDFEGGEFILCGEDMNLKRGHVLLFPSIFLYPHEVKTITKGVRYSFVSWAW
jgi:predicted 2-oxoglutarate/Fe(II)-dependent dioxygenase YbiX